MNFKTEDYLAAKFWPWQEAKKIVKRLSYQKDNAKDKPVIFSTGYGPSGLPHLGTFGEVTRTTFVRKAFEKLSDRPTKLIAVSDDMDGLRAVPSNIPNPEKLKDFIGFPLSRTPNPFGSDHKSYAHHNNACLIEFLDKFNFDYEFVSSSEHYSSGKFDTGMRLVLKHHDEIRELIASTLGEERQKTYSPFLPISPKSGRVLQTKILETDIKTDSIAFLDEDGKEVITKVTGGNCKLQWKADWGMRWKVLGVDYEMAGKDLITSYELSAKVCKIIGGRPPVGMIYEHFLDEEGHKISKSRGNGLEFDTWLRYAPKETLSYLLLQKPQSAKSLSINSIPKTVSNFYRDNDALNRLIEEKNKKALDNPVWHIINSSAEIKTLTSPPVSYEMLLNLVRACKSDDTEVIWRYILRYSEGSPKDKDSQLDALIQYAILIYKEQFSQKQVLAVPDEQTRKSLLELSDFLNELQTTDDPQLIQSALFEIAKNNNYQPIGSFFTALYQCLLGSDSGPKLGQFIAIYGIKETVQLIDAALARK